MHRWLQMRHLGCFVPKLRLDGTEGHSSGNHPTCPCSHPTLAEHLKNVISENVLDISAHVIFNTLTSGNYLRLVATPANSRENGISY